MPFQFLINRVVRPNRTSGILISVLFSSLFLISSGSGFASPKTDGFKFPQDHFFHKGYRVEWCYFIGILDTEEGKELGYELSFFRAYLGPKVALYPVHFAISDLENEKHKISQTIERELGGVAGQDKSNLWSGDYRMEVTGPADFRISAFPRTDSGFGLELELSTKPKNILIHGKNGKSLKSRKNPKFFSYYYSIPFI